MGTPQAQLLTGPPRSGKSTALSRAVALLKGANVTLAGFYTAEVRTGTERAGFDLVCVRTGERTPIARRDWDDAPERVGRYGVNPGAVEQFMHAGGLDTDVTVLDEIGRMQLLRPGFATFVEGLLDSGTPLLGTIHVFADPVTDRIKARQDVRLVTVREDNRDVLPGQLVAQYINR